MSPALLRDALLCLAFWIALFSFPRGGLRMVVALALSAFFARMGWAILHGPALMGTPITGWLFEGGACLLFVPLGPLAVWRLRRSLVPGARAQHEVAGDEWLASACRALCPAMAVARLGCLVAGCCHGEPGGLIDVGLPGWAPIRHPTPLYEIAIWLGLLGVLARTPPAVLPAVFLFGFGLARLVTEPLLAASWLAAVWSLGGALWWISILRRDPGRRLRALWTFAGARAEVSLSARPARAAPPRPPHRRGD
jgi:hypothetical protein